MIAQQAHLDAMMDSTQKINFSPNINIININTTPQPASLSPNAMVINPELVKLISQLSGAAVGAAVGGYIGLKSGQYVGKVVAEVTVGKEWADTFGTIGMFTGGVAGVAAGGYAGWTLCAAGPAPCVGFVFGVTVVGGIIYYYSYDNTLEVVNSTAAYNSTGNNIYKNCEKDGGSKHQITACVLNKLDPKITADIMELFDEQRNQCQTEAAEKDRTIKELGEIIRFYAQAPQNERIEKFQNQKTQLEHDYLAANQKYEDCKNAISQVAYIYEPGNATYADKAKVITLHNSQELVLTMEDSFSSISI